MSLFSGALSQAFSLFGGTSATVVAEYAKRTAEMEAIKQAKDHYQLEEMLTNIMVEYNNFIKDNVTAK